MSAGGRAGLAHADAGFAPDDARRDGSAAVTVGHAGRSHVDSPVAADAAASAFNDADSTSGRSGCSDPTGNGGPPTGPRVAAAGDATGGITAGRPTRHSAFRLV